ncbi:MAG: NAD-glutamate dehydrogenase domain-containing protein [Pseudomonadota bacterium]|nr:NAD-glutamate dehydrogenase domain-containing protein [Pseudomonadota bacterium]
MQGRLMLFKKQLLTYCLKEFRNAKLPNQAAFKQFLEAYFQHFIEEEFGVEHMSYFSQVAQKHFLQVLKHKPGSVSIDVANIQIQRQYLQNITRIFLCFPDKPFMIESIRTALVKAKCEILQNNLMANYELVKGKTKVCLEESDEGGETYAWLDVESHIDIDAKALKQSILGAIDDVNVVVRDWRRMQDTLRNIMYTWRDTPEDIVSGDRVQSYIAFMEWIIRSFTFLGYHGYRVTEGKYQLLGERWGLATQKGALRYRICRLDDQRFAGHSYSEDHPLLMITQTEDVSTVHRNTHKDLIVLRVYGSRGDIIEEHYFSGLLTADAYVSDPSKIPLISQKFDEVLASQGLRSRYSLRRMRYILKSLPREEIFQCDINDLSRVAYDILMIQERKVVRSYIRRDICGKFYSAMVYIPRNLLSTRLRMKIQSYLQDALVAQEISYTPFFAESVLARLHFILRCASTSEPKESFATIQETLQRLCESWDDKLYTLLCNRLGQKVGYRIASRYSHALSEQYANTYAAEEAVEDIMTLESLSEDKNIDIRLVYNKSLQSVSCRLFQFNRKDPLSLTTVFPLLTNFGFTVESEKHFEEMVADNQYIISEYICRVNHEITGNFSEIQEGLTQAIVDILEAKGVDDAFNSLMLAAGLSCKEVDVVRALCNYLHQIKFPLPIARLSQFFDEYPRFASMLVKIFSVKFQPKMLKRDTVLKRHIRDAEKYADLVNTSDDERVVLGLLNVLDAVVRTNYNLRDQEALVFKIESNKVMGIPKPAPMFEFFVFSPRTMGVHLRFSRTARGGIRNSDRVDDVRHEVFELAKTQRLKNTLIVPQGAKGGFICKQLSNLPVEKQASEVKACYEQFIRAMLSCVDNIQSGKVCRHTSLVVYDDPDPYFVVAADKGTATFSPYANAISLEHGYWLGDAFASGGQYGYDHKKMGITAKGAWESVKWHFLSMKRDVYSEPFTAVGIGDMSGDVFGNGLLLSDKFKLVAAFGWARIFIDPNPDPQLSYQERLRLFQLPKSTWADYNPGLISEGGGVFLRSEKYITLTPQMKKLFGVNKSKMEPNELIKAILRLQVDLLWNGGIGVYVKASSESHFDVSDFHNDPCRVDAVELKALVVGEGGNNGLTQLARVEYAQHGGRINTDFIDNSAGVNTSDVEVNYKILFQDLMAKKKLSLSQRNSLLTRMTHKVSEHVLRNNFLQNVQIDLAVIDAKHKPDAYIRLIDILESSAGLNRNIEKIPNKRELQNRKKQTVFLTRPEIAVLLSYCKLDLYQGISSIKLPNSELTDGFLMDYFPEVLNKKYAKAIREHMLHQELTATELTNALIGEAGMLFVGGLMDECDSSLQEVVYAYLVVRQSLGLADVYKTINQFSAKMTQDTYLFLLASLQRSIFKSCRWLIRYRDMSKVEKVSQEFAKLNSQEGVSGYLPKKYTHRMMKISEDLKAAGMKIDDVQKIAESRYSYQLYGIHAVASVCHATLPTVKEVYYQIAHMLRFHRIKERLHGLKSTSRWESIQCAAVDDDLGQMVEKLTKIVLLYAEAHKCPSASAFEYWTKAHSEVYMDIRRSLNEIIELRKIDLSVFVVVLGRVSATLDGF